MTIKQSELRKYRLQVRLSLWWMWLELSKDSTPKQSNIDWPKYETD